MNRNIVLILVALFYINTMNALPKEIYYLTEDKTVGFVDMEISPLIRTKEPNQGEAIMCGEQEILIERRVHLLKTFLYIIDSRKSCKLMLDELSINMDSLEYDKEGEYYIFGKEEKNMKTFITVPAKAYNWNRTENTNIKISLINTTNKI